MIKKINSILIVYWFLISCNNDHPVSQSPSLIIQDTNKIVGLAEIQPEQKIISLYAQTGGTVRQVIHDMGDTVRKGEIIALLDTQIEEALLRQAMSKLSTQEAVINNNQAQLESLHVKAANTQETYNRNELLIQSGGVTRLELDNSRFENEAAQKNVNAQQQAFLQSKARLNELRTDVQYAATVLDQKKIRAPYDGTILSMDIKTGNTIAMSQSLGDFAPAGRLMAVTEIDELYAGKIKTGMKAYIRAQGKMDTLATGTVQLLSPYLSKKSLFSDGADNMEDRRVREGRIILDSGSQVIIGNRVECVISIK